MYIVSTSKKTLLSDFANLETKSTFVHANEESTDFQFNAQRRVFVEVNKKAGLAVMRIKEKQQNAPELKRVRKLTIESAYSVGCAKIAANEIAIGQSSGYVKVFNFSTAQLIHRYPADQSSSTVLYVDYNCTDDYIAAVLEGGKINIYGTKTKQRIQTICNDDVPTLARFHPSKRFHLGVASEKGTVSVFDVQLNRSIFHVEDAHDAPCRDVSMCSAQPSLLVSVGYDSRINIFDIRCNQAQAQSVRLVSKHPLSTVALSECGTYLCAGNLKGELIAYDARNTKSPMAVRSIHDGCAVTRCAFVPMPTEERQSSSFSSSNNVTMDVGGGRMIQAEPMPTDELRKSITANLVMTQQQLDSLSNNMATPAAARQTRDSFCDLIAAQRPLGLDRLSINCDSFNLETLRSKAINTEERQTIYQDGLGPSSLESASCSTVDVLEQTPNASQRCNILGEDKLKRTTEADELNEQSVTCSASSSTAESNKENPPWAEVEQTAKASQAQQLPIMTSSKEHNELLGELTYTCDLLDKRFAKLEPDLKWSSEKIKFTILMWVERYWNRQTKHLEETYDALHQLLLRDDFLIEFCHMQAKNRVLKDKLKQLLNEQEKRGHRPTDVLSTE